MGLHKPVFGGVGDVAPYGVDFGWWVDFTKDAFCVRILLVKGGEDMAALNEGEMLIMRPKKDPDAVTIQAVLWLCVIAFGALAVIEKEPWAFWCLCVPGIVASFLYALYPHGRAIVVGEEGIESVVFFVFRRFVPWERVVSYREKKKQGEYYFDMNWKRQMMGTDGSGWYEDSFRLKVSVASGLPLYVSNGYTEYKQFKKLLREKGVPRIKAKKK